MNFDLPITSANAKPEFRDAKSCATWLQTLPLINVGPSHGRLLGELEELNCCEITPSERLQILELLREPVQFVQTEHAKKFTNRAVPLAKSEREILANVRALWSAAAQGYIHCAQALAGVNRGLLAGSTQLALACQRALWCAAQNIAEQHRCYQEVSADDWKLLHRLYAFVEEQKLGDQQVGHPVQKDLWKTTCMETYTQALLLQLANPRELTARQQALTARWLDRWGTNVRLRSALPQAKDKPAYPMVVDLGGDEAPVRENLEATATRRFLDVTELDKSIRMRLSLLQKGDSPEKLSLGEDVPPQLAEHLLKLLHRLWCEDKPAPAPTRKAGSAKAELTSAMGALHYFITGLPFRQPGQAKELTQAQREEIATFGRISTHADTEYAKQHGFTLEEWQILDESLTGMRIQRLAGAGRFGHNQLVAIRPLDARSFVLATTRWLAIDRNYVPQMGVHALPGVPQGVAIRATGLNAMADKYIPALMLSAVPALRSPESLVLPVGWYKPKRVIEVFSDQSRQVLLSAVIERGSDFERIAFESI